MDLIEYLDQIGMKNYQHIIEEGTTGEVISEWELSDFEDAGVSDLSDRVKLFLFFSHLKNPTMSSKFTVPYVVQFLDSESMKQYAGLFQQYGINGDILLTCKTAFLNEIGVESVLDASKIIVLFRKYTGDGYNHEKSKQDLISAINSSDIKNKSEYLKAVEDHSLSSCLLKEGGVELLKELGITQQKSKLLMRKINM